MEGVGARLGRTSTRYGPATVFTGPVRRWKKKWVHVPPPNSAAATNNLHHHSSVSNGNSSSNGNSNGSHLLLYKWTPISQSQNNAGAGNNNGNGDARDEDGVADVVDEEPPRRKIKYIPVAVLEEQKNEEMEEQNDDEAKPIETDSDAAAGPMSKTDSGNEKPDINDVPMEENQVSEDTPVERQDLNKSTLSLNLNDRDADEDPDPEETKDQYKDDKLDRVHNNVGT